MAKSDIYLVTQPTQLQEAQNNQSRTQMPEPPRPNGIPNKPVQFFQRREKYKEQWECTPAMFVGMIIMAFAIFFLVYIYAMPNPLHPRYIDPHRDMIPDVKQGNLEVYPLQFQWDNDPSRNDSYIISLPPKNIPEISKTMQSILDVYTAEEGYNCTECWVENPTFTKPCCFHLSWVDDVCSQTNDFGYTESDGKFSPCIFLRFEKIGNWIPKPIEEKYMPLDTVDYYDPSFTQIYCRVLNSSLIENITMAPKKGFSSSFFPITKFSEEQYMPPIVAIQFKGIQSRANITVKCEILAQNTLSLDNEGMFEILFSFE